MIFETHIVIEIKIKLITYLNTKVVDLWIQLLQIKVLKRIESG